MKQILLLIILLLTINCWSKNSDSISKINSLEAKIEKLEKKLNQDSSNIHYDKIIDEYKDLNTLYYAGFGILIALFGLVFPVILYFVQIKPNIEATKETKALVKKIDEDFEKSFENHLRKNKNRLIDQAIENFGKLEEHSLSTNYNLLDTYKSEGFNEIQVIKMLKLIKNKDFDDENKTFFARLLIFQEDSNSEDYFVELIQSSPKDKKCIWGALYFANYGKTEYYDLIAEVVINGYSLVGMIASLASTSKNFAIGFLNNEHLISKHDFAEIKKFCESTEKEIIKTLNKSIVEKTLIWKKYLENK